MIVHHAWLNPDDPYNAKGIRNVYNTDKQDYNCIGYAFDVYAGINIGDWFENRIIMNDASIYDYETALQMAQFELEKEFPEWLCVQDYSNEKYPAKKFKVVAIRFSRDDYHAYKLARNGCWYNKWGRTKIIQRLPYKAVFNKEWKTGAFCMPYDSPIIFFVRPR